MKCDKLFKEAFEGIEFRYKLDDTLEGLGSQKFTAKQLEGYLLGKGVSPKEIKQSGIFEGMMDDNRALPADMWINNSGKQNIQMEGRYGYEDITLSRKGLEPESKYSVTASYVKPTDLPTNPPHFGSSEYYDEFGDEGAEKTRSLLGWRRTHIDEINGKKTLVLNEFQSDWAQTERAGRGTFESNSYTDQQIMEATKTVSEYLRNNNISIDDVIQGKVDLPPEIKKLDTMLDNAGKNIVADFPMSEVKHHQFQIVGAINDAIKEGIDTVAIPIQRENELAGSAGVTKFYESLNTKILPDIRKKLEKQGLKIKVDKKPYKGGQLDYSESFNRFINTELTQEERMDLGYLQDLATNHLETRGVENEAIFDAIESANNIDELLKALQPTATNDLWTLTIEEVPNGKVKWEVYSVLAALGLGGYATQSEASTKVSKEPSQEGKFGFAKRVGSKLNYNESDTEVADYFANIESGGDYNARNTKSSAFGKYQVIKSTLAEKAKDLGISVKEARTPEGQEMVMHSLLSDYKSRLKEFDLPVTKENMFVLHNLGQTGGVRVLRGTYTGEDIGAMRANVSSEERKLPPKELVKAYTERYNINIPPKQES